MNKKNAQEVMDVILGGPEQGKVAALHRVVDLCEEHGAVGWSIRPEPTKADVASEKVPEEELDEPGDNTAAEGADL